MHTEVTKDPHIGQESHIWKLAIIRIIQAKKDEKKIYF